MRIVFMGTPEFAVASLKALLDKGFNIVGVVTAPDKPAGRGQKLNQSAVKQFALQNNLKLLQPEKLKNDNFLQELKNLNADLQLVVAFRMLPESVWNMPALGTYNLHASLLPKYRGAAPINWAIINGETESGITTFKLKHEIDTGNILLNERVSISAEMTAGELHDVLMVKGASLLVKTVELIKKSKEENRELKFMVQDNTGVCHAPKIFKETCRIDWTKPGNEIYNLIRGLCPFPAAFTQLVSGDGKVSLMKVYSARHKVLHHEMMNGSIVTDNKTYLNVYCADGVLEFSDVQLEGKKRMSIVEFLRGYSFTENAKFS